MRCRGLILAELYTIFPSWFPPFLRAWVLLLTVYRVYVLEGDSHSQTKSNQRGDIYEQESSRSVNDIYKRWDISTFLCSRNKMETRRFDQVCIILREN